MSILRTVAGLSLATCASVFTAVAQESRGAILGRVTDSTDAVIIGARIEAVNVATNTAVTTTTNAAGNFEVPYLLPGKYRVSASLQGFTTSVREDIEVRVSDRLQINFSLAPGNVAETVVVTGQTPLLETSNASVGMVMDEKRARELPVVGGNAFYLTRLSAGVVVTGGHSAGNPMDRGAGTGVVVNGTRSNSSEVTLDGAPNMSESSSAFSPMQDLVQEFKVQTSSYDATLGRASGAVVNVSLKSGANDFHGTTYYFDSRIRAVPWFSNRWLYDPSTGPITPEKRQQANPGWLHQRWGGTLSGPLSIPKLYSGRNRTFWTFGYEGVHIQRQPTFQATVPTPQMRSGDFSALLALGPQYQLYDPATIATAANGRFSRQPIVGNVIPPNRIDPIARKMLDFYPLPNTAGTRDFRQNYFGIQREPKLYHGFLSRIDHTFSQNNRAFLRMNGSDYDTSVQTLPTIAVGTQTLQRSYGAVIDDVHVFGPGLLLNVRASFTYFRPHVRPLSQGFDLASLGFPASLINEIRTKNEATAIAFPQVVIDGSGGYTGLSSNGGNLRSTLYYNTMTTVTKMVGAHSMRFGGDFRVYRENGYNYGNVSPYFEFSNNWTRGPLDTSPAPPIGAGLASMLLGIPTAGRININAARSQRSTFTGLFFQDDWKATRRLTVNLGLRWEYDSPVVESYNRSIQDFNFDVESPISVAARTAYARAPIAELPVGAFRTMGGLTFAGVGGGGSGLWKPDKDNFAPRVGLAYQLTNTTVVRAGYGIFFDPIGADSLDVNQGGFNQPTSVIPSSDNGLSFRATLANPFPSGLELPVGAAGGLNTFLGRSVSYYYQPTVNPYSQRWSLSVQQQLPGQFLMDLSYLGNRATNLPATRELNAIPREYLSTSPVRDQQTINFLSAQVTNPFAGIPEFGGTGLANARIARSQLLRPYPHFTSITTTDSSGYSWYHSLQMSAQKRFSKGLTVQVAYTWSKFMEAISYLNETDLRPEHVVSDQDFPHRFTASGIGELPFGRGKLIGGGAGGFLNHVIGGWQLQGWYELQSGQALGFGNVPFTGNLHDIVLPRSERSPERWFNTEAGFVHDSRQALSSNIRTLSSRFTGIRADLINNLDASLFKNFRVTERYTLQFRLESYNALNHVQFANPNTNPVSTAFGTVAGEKGHGQRQMTFALKLLF